MADYPWQKDSTGTPFRTADDKPPSAPVLPVKTPVGSGWLIGGTVVITDRK
jgi:hypothetical protein